MQQQSLLQILCIIFEIKYIFITLPCNKTMVEAPAGLDMIQIISMIHLQNS